LFPTLFKAVVMKGFVTGILVSTPKRVKDLGTQIKLLKPQVDVLYVILNGYDAVPETVVGLPIVIVWNPVDALFACAVWPVVDKLDGYVVLFDDDIFYPPDYVQVMISTIDKYDRRCVACVHAFKPVDKAIYFWKEVKHDMVVDVAGCGTVAFHTGTIKPKLSDFDHYFLRDLGFSILCRSRGIDIINVGRAANWLHYLSKVKEEDAALCKRVRANPEMWKARKLLVAKLKAMCNESV
jgi:hypothetical protein